MMLRIKLCFCVPSSDGTYQVKRSVSAVMSNTCNTSYFSWRKPSSKHQMLSRIWGHWEIHRHERGSRVLRKGWVRSAPHLAVLSAWLRAFYNRYFREFSGGRDRRHLRSSSVCIKRFDHHLWRQFVRPKLISVCVLNTVSRSEMGWQYCVNFCVDFVHSILAMILRIQIFVNRWMHWFHWR